MPLRLALSRVGKPGAFRYVDASGRAVRHAPTLARIRKLAIPPAWRDVAIAASASERVQAMGTDAKGRTQYRYSQAFRERQDRAKYDRLAAFADALPRLRRRVARDLERRGLPREKVLAACVMVLEATHVRVGNETYRRANHSFGLTTLLDRHVRVKGSRVEMKFRGKSGKDHDLVFSDPRLAKIVADCRDLPGQDLFQYVAADGSVHDVKSQDLNEYLRASTGGAFTAKTFRTWTGSVVAARILRKRPPPRTKAAGRLEVASAIRLVTDELHNTPAVCRKSYVHPLVIESYLTGALAAAPRAVTPRGLSADEAYLAALLARVNGRASCATRRPAAERAQRPRRAAQQDARPSRARRRPG
ncbi:MAG: DNA topoisomerase IB [Thermoplasmatota archaeon]